MLYVYFFSIYTSTDLAILIAIMLILFVKHVCKNLIRLTEINFSSLSTWLNQRDSSDHSDNQYNA